MQKGQACLAVPKPENWKANMHILCLHQLKLRHHQQHGASISLSMNSNELSIQSSDCS